MKRLQWLENQLDRDDLSLKLRRQYEDEADARAAMLSKRQAANKAAQEEKKKQAEVIRQQVLDGNLSAIDVYGIPEFGGDYEIAVEGQDHVVYSRAARDDQNSRHVLPDHDKANAKYRKLVWDRLYHKYVRTGEVDQLDQLFES